MPGNHTDSIYVKKCKFWTLIPFFTKNVYSGIWNWSIQQNHVHSCDAGHITKVSVYSPNNVFSKYRLQNHFPFREGSREYDCRRSGILRCHTRSGNPVRV